MSNPEQSSVVEQRGFVEHYHRTRREYCSRKIGHMALSEQVELNELRLRDELVSGFAEALRGRVVSDFAFDVTDGLVVAENGEPLQYMMLRARRDAYEVASLDPQMQFMVDRFEAELRELDEVQRMVNDESAHNTIVTFSPYTDELIDRPDLLKRAMQKPECKRSMVRVSHWDGKRLHIYTRSLDNSTMESLRNTASVGLVYNFEAKSSTDMLDERIRLQLETTQVPGVIAKIITAFDGLMFERLGESTVQGRTLGEDEDIQAQVLRHPKIIDRAIEEINQIASSTSCNIAFKKAFDSCLHRYAALFESIVEGKDLPQAISEAEISQIAITAGASAVAQGKVYDMCGYIVSGDNNNPNQPAGIGLLGYETLMRYAGKKVHCPNPKCGKLVIVDAKHLRNDILHCKECLLTVSVCGDKAKADRYKKELLKDKKLRELKKRQVIEKARLKKTKDITTKQRRVQQDRYRKLIPVLA